MTKLAPHKALKSIPRGKLGFDERTVLHCVDYIYILVTFMYTYIYVYEFINIFVDVYMYVYIYTYI